MRKLSPSELQEALDLLVEEKRASKDGLANERSFRAYIAGEWEKDPTEAFDILRGAEIGRTRREDQELRGVTRAAVEERREFFRHPRAHRCNCGWDFESQERCKHIRRTIPWGLQFEVNKKTGEAIWPPQIKDVINGKLPEHRIAALENRRFMDPLEYHWRVGCRERRAYERICNATGSKARVKALETEAFQQVADNLGHWLNPYGVLIAALQKKCDESQSNAAELAELTEFVDEWKSVEPRFNELKLRESDQRKLYEEIDAAQLQQQDIEGLLSRFDAIELSQEEYDELQRLKELRPTVEQRHRLIQLKRNEWRSGDEKQLNQLLDKSRELQRIEAAKWNNIAVQDAVRQKLSELLLREAKRLEDS